MKQWWQCTIITMYENVGLCTTLFLTLLLAYGNSGSTDRNRSLLIPVIREWILNLSVLWPWQQQYDPKMKNWKPQIILIFYLNSRSIKKAHPTPSHPRPLPLLFLTSNPTRPFSSRCKNILRLLSRPETARCQEILCAGLKSRKLENKQKTPIPRGWKDVGMSRFFHRFWLL